MRAYRTFAARLNEKSTRQLAASTEFQPQFTTFEGKSYLVVPVVALIGDIVWSPYGSPGPEWMPIAVVAETVAGWNGRPVVIDHPYEDGSANSIGFLGQNRFGTIFDAQISPLGNLICNAYLDVDLAEQVGESAVNVYNRCLAGEQVEISIGGLCEIVKRQGISPRGEPYEYVCVGIIIQDHMAMFDFLTGACSISSGCGTNRMGTSNGGRRMKSWLSKLLSAARNQLSLEDTGLSDRDLEWKLWNALNDVVPGFEWVIEVYHDSKTVIYYVSRSTGDLCYRRSWSIEADGVTVKVGDTEEEVTMDGNWIAVTNQQAAPATTTTCGCESNSTTEEVPVTVLNPSPVPVPDTSGTVAEPAVTTAVVSEVATVVASQQAAQTPTDVEAWLKAQPPEVAAMFRTMMARDNGNRSALVNHLATAQSQIPRATLETMSLETLTQLDGLIKSRATTSFAAVGGARTVEDSDEAEGDALPNPWSHARKARAGK